MNDTNTIISVVCKMYDVSKNELLTSTKTTNLVNARTLICAFLYKEKKMLHKEISKLLGRDAHNLSMSSVDKFDKNIGNDSYMQDCYNSLLNGKKTAIDDSIFGKEVLIEIGMIMAKKSFSHYFENDLIKPSDLIDIADKYLAESKVSSTKIDIEQYLLKNIILKNTMKVFQLLKELKDNTKLQYITITNVKFNNVLIIENNLDAKMLIIQLEDGSTIHRCYTTISDFKI